MVSFLIAIIYVAFISLGLPDSMLGAAWPVMHGEIGADLSYAGIITMIISVGTIISSLLSDRLTRKFSAGMVTAVSTLTTAIAIFGFSVSGSFIELCLWAVPYGLGAGAIDAA
ncbi:MAG: MFS transporter, partial [Clostridia bacterium]|nr:MFS transporter [Clostridia bacterium]